MPASINPQSALGPSYLSTLLSNDLALSVSAYCDYLHLQVFEESAVSFELAELWQTPELQGAAVTLLANSLGEPWLRIVEDKNSHAIEPLKYHGWLSLEVLVSGVDDLVAGLSDSPFTVLRPVADLELSANIRACQVQGPCGEVLYLTQIKGDVPPFDLPRARCAVDRLFIPVMCAPDRDTAKSFYEGFENTKGLSFATKITVINQAYGWDITRQHPVATMVLQQQNLIEIDEIDAAKPRPLSNSLPANISSISFEVDDINNLDLNWVSKPRFINAAPYNGRAVGLVKGAADEWLELVSRQ